MLILCPFCMRPISPATEEKRLAQFKLKPPTRVAVPCETCGGDVTRDAPLDATEQELKTAADKPCCFCGQAMHHLAVRCPACTRWQEPHSAEQRRHNEVVGSQDR